MTIDLSSCKAMMSYNYHNNCCIAAVTQLITWQKIDGFSNSKVIYACPQGFGFENKGTEALSFRQFNGCFLRRVTSQRIKG